MQAFDYTRVTTVDEATTLLAGAGGRARILGGGTDLIVALRERRLTTDLVIDVKAIAELQALHLDEAGGLHLGACTPCHRIYGDPAISARYEGLVDAARLIGGVQIQGRASLGGNLCNASPAADSIPPLIVYAAAAEIAGPRGRRTVPVADFCTGPGRSVLEPDEMLVALHLPPPPPGSGAAYLRLIPRNEMDIAVAGAAAYVELDGTGRFVTGRIALAAVAPTPLVVAEAAGLLAGQRAPADTDPDAAVFAAVAAAAQAAARPITDLRGTAAYRRQVVGVLVRRALHTATARARRNV
jgi:carbon-monoxide dehydrogenase medium subunit